MFIRKTKIRSANDGGKDYFTYRIVETERIGGKVKQRTLLNLGRHFSIDSSHWGLLIERIQDILLNRQYLFDVSLSLELENAAHHYAQLIAQKRSKPVSDSIPSHEKVLSSHCDYQEVDVNRVEIDRARSIGVENLSYHAIKQLHLIPLLESLGFNGKDTVAATGNIIGRLVSPGSERHTLSWLQNQSALGEIIDHDFNKTTLTRLYQVADKLYKKKQAIEENLYQRECDLFSLESRIILYDLTNTYFEGSASANEKAAFGRSKEKRSDCRLVTMGLVLDSEGFPIRSEIFKGNVSEPATLQELINQLDHSTNEAKVNEGDSPVIIMDAGIASEGNVLWLREHGYRYIVVSRDRTKEKPDLNSSAVIVKDETRNRVVVEKVPCNEDNEVRIYCHSEGKEAKEHSMQSKASERFENALIQLHDGLSKKGCTKRYDKVLERLGRIKEKHARVANGYHIEVITDTEKNYAESINWKKIKTKKEATLGVYCLRSNILDWTAETLWRTYVTLTEVESTFRSLKTDFGLRPIYHQYEHRVNAHLFISLLAYHVAHTLRFQLKQKNIHLSWHSLCQVMSTQQRGTVILHTADGEVIHLRTTSRAEPAQKEIYNALSLAEDAIGKRKTNISKK